MKNEREVGKRGKDIEERREDEEKGEERIREDKRGEERRGEERRLKPVLVPIASPLETMSASNLSHEVIARHHGNLQVKPRLLNHFLYSSSTCQGVHTPSVAHHPDTYTHTHTHTHTQTHSTDHIAGVATIRVLVLSVVL